MVTRWKSRSGCFSNRPGSARLKASSKADEACEGTEYHRLGSPQ